MSGRAFRRGIAGLSVASMCVLAGAAGTVGAQGADWWRGTTRGSSVDTLGNPAPVEPDPRLTPGATLPVSVEDICTPGYSHKVRHVPVGVKREAYALYGITRYAPGEYEIDHLISLELGGSNSLRNLWPESFATAPWNAHVKDALENLLHRQVCADRLDLAVAQHDIATDWVAAYQKYFHRSLPRPRRERRAGPRDGGGSESSAHGSP